MVERETGMPGKLIDSIVNALQGADHLGSLLQVDKAVDETIARYESTLPVRSGSYKQDLFGSPIVTQQKIDFDALAVRESIVEGLERFLKSHTSGDDLGLRTRGRQLAAGVRFMRMLKERSYHLVIANPPYQGTNKLKDSRLYESLYPSGKSDLFAGMTIRAIELLCPSGLCAMVALSNWMFTTTYLPFRRLVLSHHLAAIAELGKAAFTTGGTLISTACYIIRIGHAEARSSVAVRPMPPSEVKRDSSQPHRIESALRMQRGRYQFDSQDFSKVPGYPCVYWWPKKTIESFAETELLGNVALVCEGWSGENNPMVLRSRWELAPGEEAISANWAPFIGGANGAEWWEPLRTCIQWKNRGLVMKVSDANFFRNELQYFQTGVSFTTIGSRFGARLHRYPSVFGSTGRSVIGADRDAIVCSLNTSFCREIIQDLNPTIHFTVGGVSSLPLLQVPGYREVVSITERAFSIHESHREPSVEFQVPGPSPWRHAQRWAQQAVDRMDGQALPAYVEQVEEEPPTDHISFAFGVALGRFNRDGGLVRGPADRVPLDALPNGILFLDGSLDENDDRDSLGRPESSVLLNAWSRFGSLVGTKRDLRSWLRLDFFANVHREMYENRPIYFPISSRNRTFVAWINIHRWNANTLRFLLAEHLQGMSSPRVDGEYEDLRRARAEGEKGSDARFLQVQKWKEELDEFISLVKECAEKGPRPTCGRCPKREVDSRYDPILDDGVMVNSAALWPLLDPQWKDPKGWWEELAVASQKGNKDYDWSHLAMRYFPKRVDEKCRKDPSFGVAHGCFWKYHPAKAWAWELRLQDEIAPDFRIEEASYRGDGGDVEHRAAYLREHALEAIATIEKEVLRRRKDAPGKIIQEIRILELGLWSTEPEACWDMETRIIKKQEFGFRLIAPDEAEARAKLIAETPQKETGRRRMLEGKGGSAAYLAGWEEAMENS